MTMPIENFHQRILPKVDVGYTETTSWRFPTPGNIHINQDSGVTSWDADSLDATKDDLSAGAEDINKHIAGVTGFKENIAGNMKSVTCLSYDYPDGLIPTDRPGTTIDSFSFWVSVLVDSDSANSYNVYLNNIALHMWNPPVGAPIYPSPAVGYATPIVHVRGNADDPHSQSAADQIAIYNIPAADFGGPTITPEMINSPSFTMSLQFRFDGTGGSVDNTKIILYVMAMAVTYTVPAAQGPGTADAEPNLIKMGTI